MYHIILFTHLLGATIWTGGHLILACTILPQALQQRQTGLLMAFEACYEKIGMPALLVQVVTGLWMISQQLGDSPWLDITHPTSRLLQIKLALLLGTILLALDARLRLIPRLTPERLPALAWHIIPVTIISVLFVLAGFSRGAGWLM